MKVSVVCVADRPHRLPCLFWSLVAQTHADWELLVLDQTQYATALDSITEVDREAAIKHGRLQHHHVEYVGDWGQSMKEAYGHSPEHATGGALMFPNDDAYYPPTALATMIYPIEQGVADLVVCGWLYDLFGYNPFPPRIAEGRIDVGGFMVRADTFRSVKWRSKSQTGDFQLLVDMVKAGARVHTVRDVLYVKN